MTLFQRFAALAVLLVPVMGATAVPPVRLGVDRFVDSPPDWAIGRKLGLITNDGAVSGDGTPVADRVAASKHWSVVAYFAPEHGLAVDRQGTIADGARNGRPVYSLYGKRQAPPAETLKALDLLVCDLPDVGARFYTYISTMSLAMQAAKAAQRPFVVLDRPNPIGGHLMEGPMLQPAFLSFTGPQPIPVRHGMTIGELAGLFNSAFGIGAELRVVAMSGWTRGLWHDQTGLPWRNPSPRMVSLDAATLYPGLCFFEATNVDVRLPDRLFTALSAPWLNAEAVAAEVRRREPPGVKLTVTRFAKGPGIAFQVTDRERLRPVRLAFELLAAICKHHPDKLIIEPRGFDRLAGTDQVRLRLLAGKPADQLDPDPAALGDFADLRAPYLIYGETP